MTAQAIANYGYGPRGLNLMARRGRTAGETVEALVYADDEREHRQVGVVDASGRAAIFTGECFDWAGGLTGEHYAAQGNILVGRETVEAMAKEYETVGGFVGRLLAALDAGQRAGGDSRGG